MGDQDLELRPQDAVWPNVIVSDDSIAQCIRELRSKLGSAFSRPGSCEIGVIRGGSFAAGSRRVRSAIRIPVRTTKHFYHIGLRVALSLGS